MLKTKSFDGSEIHYRAIGKGPAVVMVHGFGIDSSYWLPFVAPFLSQRRFIIPDLRGHGRTRSFDASSNPLESLRMDLEAILDRESPEQFSLVGFSLGAIVSLELTKGRWGGGIKDYMHIDMSPKIRSDASWNFGVEPALESRVERLLSMWDEQHAHKREALHSEYLSLLLFLLSRSYPSHFFSKPLSAISSSNLLQKIHSGNFLHFLPTAEFSHKLFVQLFREGHDGRDLVRNLSMPGVILGGGDLSFFGMGWSRWMNETWNQSRLVEFPGNGHGLIYGSPFKFKKALGKFLLP